MTAIAAPQQEQRATRGGNDWRQSILFLCLGLMNVLWLAPALQVFLSSDVMEDPLPMPLENMVYLVGGNILFGMSVRRLLITRQIPFKQQRPIILLGAIVSVLATVSTLPLLLANGSGELTFDYGAAFDLSAELIPNGIRVFPIAILLYFRGTEMARFAPPPSIVTVQGRLAIGVYFLTALLASQAIQEAMVTVLPMLFGCILLANALSRSATLKLTNEVRNQRFGGSWFGLLLLSALGVTLAGFFTALIFGAIDDEQLRRALELPLLIFLGAIVLILSPFAYVISWLIGQIPDPPPEDQSQEALTGTREVVASKDNPQLDIGDEIRAVYDVISEYLPIIIVGGVILLIVYFWLSYFLLPETQQLDDEESENIDDREGFGKLNLGKQLKKLRKSLSNIAQSTFGGNLFAEFTIRWAYGRMEKMGKKRGFARVKSQTPYEYRLQLYKAFPDGEEYVRTITNAYVAVRYGERPEESANLENVRTALDTLKTISPPETP